MRYTEKLSFLKLYFDKKFSISDQDSMFDKVSKECSERIDSFGEYVSKRWAYCFAFSNVTTSPKNGWSRIHTLLTNSPCFPTIRGIIAIAIEIAHAVTIEATTAFGLG